MHFDVFQQKNQKNCLHWRGGGGEGGTSIYELYRYVPWDRVGFLRFSILKSGIIFAPVNKVFPALSLDMVPNLYQLNFQCKNA